MWSSRSLFGGEGILPKKLGAPYLSLKGDTTQHAASWPPALVAS